MLELYENILDFDLEPFLLFNSNGKLIKYNQEAEYLLNFITIKELFELTLSYAPKNFGFQQHYLPLNYGKIEFYALLTGYIDEEFIILRLYKSIINKQTTIDNTNLKLVNIYSLIDISKNSTLLNSKIKIKELYDVSIPDIKIDINNFLLLLNKCFTLFKTSKNLTIKTYIKVGEYKIINNIKYKIFIIEMITTNLIKQNNIIECENQAIKTNITLTIKNNSLSLEFPLIL